MIILLSLKTDIRQESIRVEVITHSGLIPGTSTEVLNEVIDRKALEFNEKPMVLTAYPSGEGEKPEELLDISGEKIYFRPSKKLKMDLAIL